MTAELETIGQIPGSSEELFGDGESQLAGASQEWLGKKKA